MTPKQVLVDVADLEALRERLAKAMTSAHSSGDTISSPYDAADAALEVLVAAIPEPEPPRIAGLIARRFHEEYEHLAPMYGWDTQEASRVDWDDLPGNQRRLMTHVVGTLLASAVIRHPTDTATAEPLPPSFVPLLDDDGRPVVRVPIRGEWFLANNGCIRKGHPDAAEPRTIYTKVETEA